ncbi:MAG TPA: diguanylate cyclase [Candidatus Omnitrophota bacterium]|nr:diguanylate cyclase [Candidatus Omnitrophota bacterium]
MIKKGRILVADDEADIATILARRLIDAGYEVSIVSDPTAVLQQAKMLMPDLILLDIMMPGMNGIEVKNHLNEEKTTAEIPVIFLTAKATADDVVKGFRLRADDYIPKPFEMPELLVRIEAVISRRRYFEEIAMKDAMTGLQNVRVFKSKLQLFFDIAQRYGRVFSVAVLDIDGFKKINDTFGHTAGDRILKEFSNVMTGIFRRPDVLVRYGGDEFVVLLPESNEAQSAIAIGRLRKSLEGKSFEVSEDGEKISVTFSAGISTYHGDLKNATELFEQADRNMYAEKLSKKEGGV